MVLWKHASCQRPDISSVVRICTFSTTLFFFFLWRESAAFSQWHLHRLPHAATYSHAMPPNSAIFPYFNILSNNFTIRTKKNLSFCLFSWHFLAFSICLGTNEYLYGSMSLNICWQLWASQERFPMWVELDLKTEMGTHICSAYFDVNQNIFELEHILFLIHVSPFDVTSKQFYIQDPYSFVSWLIDVILPQ